MPLSQTRCYGVRLGGTLETNLLHELSIFEEEDVVMLIVLGLGEICEELSLEGGAPRGIIVAEVNAEDWLWMEE